MKEGMTEMRILETPRLILRQMDQNDLSDLAEILQDEITMTAYERAFSDEEVQEWLDKQLLRYEQDGFGLWAVVLKESGEMVGQCGISLQQLHDKMVPEIGYLFKRKHWHNGYAAEAAIACREYAFETLGLDAICSIIRDTNTASINVAKRNGMQLTDHFVKHYRGVDMPHVVYSVRRDDLPVASAAKT